MGRIIAASKGLVVGTTVQLLTSGYQTLSKTAPIAAVAGFLNLMACWGDLPPSVLNVH